MAIDNRSPQQQRDEEETAPPPPPPDDGADNDGDYGTSILPSMAGGPGFANPLLAVVAPKPQPAARLPNGPGYPVRNYGSIKGPPPLGFAEGTPANDRILAAAKILADRLVGRNAADLAFREMGIDTSAAWCMRTDNAIFNLAGLRGTGSSLAADANRIGQQVSVDDLQAGDAVRHIDPDGVHGHTGIVWRVNKDENGHVKNFIMLSGNNGHHTMGFAQINQPASYATYYRHDGTPSDQAPAAVAKAEPATHKPASAQPTMIATAGRKPPAPGFHAGA